MTRERAQYLLDNMRYGAFPMAYRPSYDLGSSPLDPNGLTEDEDRYVKSVWNTMPGHTNFFNAVQRIARGQV